MRWCYRVTGVDFSPTAIELARRNHPALKFIVGDCLALELATASFDLVVDNHVLHCIFLHEIARVLRPGGLVFSETMTRDGSADITQLGFDPTTFVSKNNNRYLVSETELDAELAAAGFEIMLRETRHDDIDHAIRVARQNQVLAPSMNKT